MRLYRYPDYHIVVTRLDPLTDATQWIRGLCSEGYVQGLLAELHGLDQQQVNESARAITAHARAAMDLFDLAFGTSSSQASYLPLYYALLNLSKIVVIASGKLASLNAQRWHGVQWSGINTRSNDLLTDHVTVHEKGALPLFYRSITGAMWPRTASRAGADHRRRIQLRHVYPLIANLEYEYEAAYASAITLAPVTVSEDAAADNARRLQATFDGDVSPATRTKRHFPILARWKAEGDVWVTPYFQASSWSTAQKKLDRWGVRRYLLYETTYGADANIHHSTPAWNSNFQMPEEFPLLLAIFHLGSVARYDPQRMQRLANSRAAILIATLPTQAALRFIELVWSYLHQKTVVVSAA